MQEARDCAKRLEERFGDTFRVKFETWSDVYQEWGISHAISGRTMSAPTLEEVEARIIHAMEERQPVPDIYAEDNEPCPF